jgi:hypothetical protein
MYAIQCFPKGAKAPVFYQHGRWVPNKEQADKFTRRDGFAKAFAIDAMGGYPRGTSQDCLDLVAA